MATVLSHQQLQHQHHQQHQQLQQLLYSPHHQQFSSHNININSLQIPQQQIVQNQQNQNQQHQQQQQQSSGHFCKDCGVMFESSTSLEVHLSYHKENLLTRWATQDNSDNKSSGGSSSGGLLLNPSSPSPRSDHSRSTNSNDREINNTNSSVDSTSSNQSYFNPMESHGQYLPPQYNNNTGDHHMEPTYRPSTGGSNSSGGQTPVDSHPIQIYENFHSAPPPGFHHGGHPLFSPNSGNSSAPTQQQNDQQQQQQQQGVRDSAAEILDLDSHKVHIYQHQQQQQQQQLGLAERSFFHRPYLPHLLPSLPPVAPQQPTPVNAWPGDHHFTTSRFSPAGYPPVEHVTHNPHQPTAFYAPSALPIVQPPPPPTTSSGTNGLSPTSFEIIRVENPGYPSGEINVREHTGPPGYQPQGVLSSHLQQPLNGRDNNGPVTGFGHHSPYAPPQGPVLPQQQQVSNIKIENSTISPGAIPTKAQRSSPSEPGSGTGRGRGGGGQAAVNPSPSAGGGGKTKGWKGGECKRPKTYNCPACNKWFTSSGHLKRHYGTTLHKNSIKQLGENPNEEIIKPQPKGKKAVAAMAIAKAQAAAEKQQQKQMSRLQQMPPHNQNMISPNKGDDSSSSSGNEKSNSMYGAPSSIELSHNNNNSNNINGGPLPSIINGDLVNKGPQLSFANLNNSHPPVPISSPNAFNNYHLYGPPPPHNPNMGNPNNHPGLPPHHHIPHGPPPHPQHLQGPFPNNGFSLDFVPTINSIGPMYGPGPDRYETHQNPNINSNNQNGNQNPSQNSNGENVPLPPFSSVGLSHYERGGGNPDPGSNPNTNPNPPSSLGNGNNNPMENNNNFANRATPPYHSQQQQPGQMNSTPSPHNNNNSSSMHNNSGGHHDTSFDSERDNQQQQNNNNNQRGGGSSPVGGGVGIRIGARSDSSGSMEGSLDDGMMMMDHSNSDGCSDGSGSPHSSTNSTDMMMMQKESGGGGPGGENGGEAEVLKCPDCSKTFGRACYLTQHANSSHSGGKPFKCQTCGKRFPEEPALSDHVAKHGSEKPYKCDLCPKQFNHKTDLRRHLCLHTGEKPFVCNQCGKGFIRKDHMTKHSETHRKKTTHSSNNNVSSN